jgi:hypothetical protein
MADIKGFVTMVLKNGGAQLVVVLGLAWLFQQYFPINSATVAVLLEWLLWAAFVDGIFRLVVGEFYWIRYKELKFQTDKTSGNYAEVEKEVDAGSPIKSQAQDLGLDGLQYLKDKLLPDNSTKALDLIAKIDAMIAGSEVTVPE